MNIMNKKLKKTDRYNFLIGTVDILALLMICFHLFSDEAIDSWRRVSSLPCTCAWGWGNVSPSNSFKYLFCFPKEPLSVNDSRDKYFLFFSSRAANLYVSMNEGLSFISSSVTITTMSCVSSNETAQGFFFQLIWATNDGVKSRKPEQHNPYVRFSVHFCSSEVLQCLS